MFSRRFRRCAQKKGEVKKIKKHLRKSALSAEEKRKNSPQISQMNAERRRGKKIKNKKTSA